MSVTGEVKERERRRRGQGGHGLGLGFGTRHFVKVVISTGNPFLQVMRTPLHKQRRGTLALAIFLANGLCLKEETWAISKVISAKSPGGMSVGKRNASLSVPQLAIMKSLGRTRA